MHNTATHPSKEFWCRVTVVTREEKQQRMFGIQNIQEHIRLFQPK
jgi:hypothetical protein